MRQLIGRPKARIGGIHTGALVYFDATAAEPTGHKVLFALGLALCIWVYKQTPQYSRFHKKAVEMRVKRRYGVELIDDTAPQ